MNGDLERIKSETKKKRSLLEDLRERNKQLTESLSDSLDINSLLHKYLPSKPIVLGEVRSKLEQISKPKEERSTVPEHSEIQVQEPRAHREPTMEDFSSVLFTAQSTKPAVYEIGLQAEMVETKEYSIEEPIVTVEPESEPEDDVLRPEERVLTQEEIEMIEESPQFLQFCERVSKLYSSVRDRPGEDVQLFTLTETLKQHTETEKMFEVLKTRPTQDLQQKNNEAYSVTTFNQLRGGMLAIGMGRGHVQPGMLPEDEMSGLVVLVNVAQPNTVLRVCCVPHPVTNITSHPEKAHLLYVGTRFGTVYAFNVLVEAETTHPAFSFPPFRGCTVIGLLWIQNSLLICLSTGHLMLFHLDIDGRPPDKPSEYFKMVTEGGFSEFTNVSFCPANSIVSMTASTITGRVVHSLIDDFKAGSNSTPIGEKLTEENCKLLQERAIGFKTPAHMGPVLAMDVCTPPMGSTGNEAIVRCNFEQWIVTGGSDWDVRLWLPSSVVQHFVSSVEMDSSIFMRDHFCLAVFEAHGPITGVAFSPKNPLAFVSCDANGVIQYFDLHHDFHGPRYVFSLEDDKVCTSLVIHNNHIIVGTMSGNVRVFMVQETVLPPLTELWESFGEKIINVLENHKRVESERTQK
ncbi:hypothetical protein PCE1_003749 [Barthelona sp. PCE]